MIHFMSAKILKKFVPASVKHLHLAAANFGSYYKWTFWRIYCLACEAEARHMYCFSGVVVVSGGIGVNFCRVFAFRSFSQGL